MSALRMRRVGVAADTEAVIDVAAWYRARWRALRRQLLVETYDDDAGLDISRMSELHEQMAEAKLMVIATEMGIQGDLLELARRLNLPAVEWIDLSGELGRDG